MKRYYSKVEHLTFGYGVYRTFYVYSNNKRQCLRESRKQDRYLRGINSLSGKFWFCTRIRVYDVELCKCIYDGCFKHNGVKLVPINKIK